MLKFSFIIAFLTFCNSSFCQKNEVFITEIFADPTPTKGLPEYEYLELFNSTEKSINLKNYTLVYGNSKTTINEGEIKANSYAIICRKNYAESFKIFGNVISIANLSLNNTGALLILYNEKNEIQNIVNYKDTWYTEGKNQAYSLEMRDIRYPCLGKENWTSSIDKIGGTPGKINTANANIPDLKAPVLDFYNTENNILKLIFNESLSLGFLENAIKNISIANPKKILGTKFSLGELNSIELILNEPIYQDESVELTISNLIDCSGNVSEEFKFNVINIPPAEKGALLISEVLFNANSAQSEFVEIYNSSKQSINLKNWILSSSENIDDYKPIIQNDFILKSKKYLIISKTADKLLSYYAPKLQKEQILEMSKFPTLNNTEGKIFVYNNDSIKFDQLFYNEKLHDASVINKSGVSLERVEFNKEASGGNLRSASTIIGYASPGSTNSNSAIVVNTLRNNFFFENQIFDPNDIKNNTAILNYELNETGINANISIHNKNGIQVKQLLNNALLGTSGQIIWNGENENGIIQDVGYYYFKITTINKNKTETFNIKVVLAGR